jgi:hypothetical protein
VTTYQPLPRWLVCTACDAMWTGFDEAPCWACGGTGRPSYCPVIGSQHGYAPADFDDPRPAV